MTDSSEFDTDRRHARELLADDDLTALHLGVVHDDDTVEYAVSDDGIGIDPGQLDGIFEVFQRLHTREEFQGTGIGLSVCRKIVARHDGEIRVESSPGEGSTFLVTLPVAGESDE